MTDPVAAFPVPADARQTGITMRDWIAVAAMQGVMSKGLKVQADRAMTETERQDEMAAYAYQMADAMLRTREPAAAASKKKGRAADARRAAVPAADRPVSNRRPAASTR